jgi:hypothetical protein
MIRANILLDEQKPLDAMLLRKSLFRLNRTGLFEPVDERNVEMRTDPAAGAADVRIHLRERPPGSWLLTGPLGPLSVAGPLQFMIASRLPAWGQGVFELSTYFAGVSMIARADPISRRLFGSSITLLPVPRLQRPFLPGEGWKSGVTLAPQLGWRATGVSYGLAQARERLIPLLQGDQPDTSVLPLIMERDGGRPTLFCEPKAPSWKWSRTGAGVALQFATSFATL